MNRLLEAIPRDKLLHLVVGAGVALVALALWHLAMLVPVLAAHPIATGVSLSGLMVGAAGEAKDRLSNLAAAKRGLTPLHGVEWMDLLMTWLGSTALALALVGAGLG